MDRDELEAFLTDLDDPDRDEACQDMALAMVSAERPRGVRRIIRTARRHIRFT